MKIGDLVVLKGKTTQPASVPRVATIVNTWTVGYSGKLSGIDVMWAEDGGSRVSSFSPHLFKVVSKV